MIRRLAFFLLSAPVLLSFALCLASVGAAMARVQAGLSWQITLCTGEGVVEISLDAGGNPVSRAHHCPDCLTGGAFGLPPEPVCGPFVAEARPPRLVAAGIAAPGLGRLPPRAQGPPLAV